jgi:hypothetical protein
MTEADPTSPTADPLGPVRDALLRQARAEADTELTSAREQSRLRLDAARQRAVRIVDDARVDGARRARALSAPAIVAARRRAQEIVLAAQRGLYEQLKDQSRAAALALQADPGYPEMMRTLTRRARGALGTGARITQSRQGGLVATSGSLRLDLTLPVLADRALEDLGGEVRRLWTM